ncbi:glycoside hydrolase family 78 protein [Dysgonomonas sp. 511]|uniref:glycoside hydrolase family 78 protein n=1 Tax=Dysgonomonas sp. 511 TaxID=2302930 RepID=UPI0013D46BA5|nr:glycoside hydrolase family 78 protein [Dysgonomonas sp. 511]NDV78091.1 hydrolase [Dysgonomonas sp. 511]
MKILFIGVINFLLCLNTFALDISNLTTELQETPLAVDVSSPRFGWLLTSTERSEYQTAYQIVVMDGKTKIWDSGKVNSSASQFVSYKGKPLTAGVRYTWKVKVWNKSGKASESSPSYFEMAPSFTSSDIQWIGAITREDANLPIGRRDLHGPSFKKQEYKNMYDQIDTLALKSIDLRKTFSTSKKVERAVVHVSGLGHYNLFLNGKRVSKDIFTPVWSDYDKTVYYNTYQVDSLIVGGENAIGVRLGNGFYNAVGNRYRKLWISFGPPTLFFKMHIYYADGSKDVISSDNTWKYSLSPVTFNDIYGGENYDARLEQQGWNKPGFDDKAWKPVVMQDAPKGKLRAQQVTNVRCMKEYSSAKVTKIDSSYVLDMGQNLSGYPAIRVKGKAGQTIKLTVGEQLNKETGLVSQKQSGSPHTYYYTLKGEGEETWHPEFSYYGFQYIQVDGANILSYSNDKPTILDIKSHFIYNAVDENGHFESSNEIFNKAHILIKNAVRSNMQAVFTDCPHREKLGWLEETHLNGPGLLYNWNLTQFFNKVMQDMADGQQANGLIPNIVPEYVVFGHGLEVFRDSPEWGGASVIMPWMYYRFYGDDTLLRKYYNVMKGYVDYLTSMATDHIVSHGLGDWYDYGEHRAGFSKNSPVPVSATAHYYYVTHLFAEAAKLQGKKADEKKYSALAKEIRKAFNDKFFDKASKQYGSGSQFCNAVAVFMNLVEPQDKQAVMANLKKDIAERGNRLTTGDVGNRYLFQALALNGENELMYQMHNHEDAPGYGFQIKFGATTLTEQWDPRKGASWNHFMMGQIDEWFFRSLAGIEPTTPGFREFTIQPQPVGDLKWVKTKHKTLYGDIKVEWENADGKFKLSVLVPVNTKAIVILPNGQREMVGSGHYNFECKI